MDKVSGINQNNPVTQDPKKKLSNSDEYKNIFDKTNGVNDSPAATSDETAVKSKARELPPEAVKALAETPEVRAEKVEQIRRQIAEGTYKIDSATIAQAMLNKGFKI